MKSNRLILLIVLIILFSIGILSDDKSHIFVSKTLCDQLSNFQSDLKQAESYDYHEDLGRDYVKAGNYDKAVEEYKKAINIIENIPGENWAGVSKEDMDRINKESHVSRQIFSRYRLIDALEKAGRFDEALENVEWLMRNQKMKGKEEFLRKKLESMKNNLLQKMQREQI